MLKHKPKAILFLVITALLWSIGGLLIKLVDANPLAIAGVRSAIASVLLLAVLRKPKINGSFAQIGAAISYAALVLLFVAANKMTTSANAILLQFTAPVYVAFLGAWILREKTKLLDWITVVIVMGGMTLFFFDDLDTKGLIGNVIAAASGVVFALFTIFMRMQKNGSPLESVWLGNIITAAIGCPFLFQAMPDSSGWLFLVMLGVFQLGLPYILYAKAIKHVTALEVILITVIEPLLNPVWVFLMLGEAPGPLALTGGVIVTVSVMVRCVLAIKPTETSQLEKTGASS